MAEERRESASSQSSVRSSVASDAEGALSAASSAYTTAHSPLPLQHRPFRPKSSLRRFLSVQLLWRARVAAWYLRRALTSYTMPSDVLYLDWRRHDDGERMAAPPPQPQDVLRLVCVSDTHSYHSTVPLPAGDVLIHCGDLTFQSHAFDAVLADFADTFLPRQARHHTFFWPSGRRLTYIYYVSHTRSKYLCRGTMMAAASTWGRSPWRPGCPPTRTTWPMATPLSAASLLSATRAYRSVSKTRLALP